MLESLQDLFLQKQKAETVSFDRKPEKKPDDVLFKKPKSIRRLSKKDISSPCNFKHVSGLFVVYDTVHTAFHSSEVCPLVCNSIPSLPSSPLPLSSSPPSLPLLPSPPLSSQVSQCSVPSHVKKNFGGQSSARCDPCPSPASTEASHAHPSMVHPSHVTHAHRHKH